MRITRDLLHKIARNTVAERLFSQRDIVCVYLTGSLLEEQPLLGGTTDIDLMIVHAGKPDQTREIKRINDDVHLDIHHLDQGLFRYPRSLRTDPWVGSYLCANPIVLHDQQHWFEFTQASVCSQFDLPENVIRRALPMAENARNTWIDLTTQGGGAGVQSVQSYLSVLEQAANAIAVLTGPPLPERRLLTELSSRCEALERPGLYEGLVDLLYLEEVDSDSWKVWLDSWGEALTGGGDLSSCHPDLHPARRNYFTKAAEACWEEYPSQSIWLLLRHWTLLLACMPDGDKAHWQQACEELGLDDAHWDARMQQLDGYLDSVEETLDDWSKQRGI